MTELIVIDLFLRFGISRLMETDWSLALAVVAVVLLRYVVAGRKTK